MEEKRCVVKKWEKSCERETRRSSEAVARAFEGRSMSSRMDFARKRRDGAEPRKTDHGETETEPRRTDLGETERRTTERRRTDHRGRSTEDGAEPRRGREIEAG